MVFAPGGDGGCPHQPVSVVVGTTVFYSDCVYCEAFGSQVFGIGVIRGRIQTKLGQMSWTGAGGNRQQSLLYMKNKTRPCNNNTGVTTYINIHTYTILHLYHQSK